MGARVYLAAAGMFLASLFVRLRGPRQRTGVFLVPAVLLAFSLPGCAGVNVLMLSSETFSPRTNHVEILEQEPTRSYVQIAVLSVDSIWLSLDSKREKILAKAATLGADAVIFGDLRLPPLNQGNHTAGQSTPPSSLPPKDVDKPMLDDLHSSARDDDVRVVLVRGGGHGGGRGGGHRGHWGGRSGHPGFRPWGGFYAPYYGPGYRGYGLYGPGWWGYGPYGGGYPYYGGYAPYSYGTYPGYGYGYMNTVMIGTAIHYTD